MPLDLKKIDIMKSCICFFFTVICVFLFVSCKETEGIKSTINEVSLEVSVSKEESTLSEEFTDVEIIPLENKREALVCNVHKMIVTDNGMYLWDNGPIPQVLSFSLDGKYRGNIGKMGHAKGEYQLIMNIAANHRGDTIAILKYPNADLFNKDGKFLSSLVIKDDKGTEDMLLTKSGYYLGYLHRHEKYLMSMYSNNNVHLADFVETSTDIIRSSLIAHNGSYLQQDNNNIYCLDIFNSSIYVINKTNPDDITRYTINMENILTEDIAGKVADDGDKIHEYYHIASYQADNGVVRGLIERNKDYYECYGFKFSISDKTVTLMKHKGLDYDFICNYKGYFYKLVSAEQILSYLDSKNTYLEPQRKFLGNALNSLDGKVSLTDNYYIIKMRSKE